MSYIEHLYEHFKDFKIELVYFDNGATDQSMQCYLVVSNIDSDLMKDKGSLALDLGNYIYKRYGFSYEMPPEYHKREEPKNSLAFYQSKAQFKSDQNQHVREWILEHDKTERQAESILYKKRHLEIPHVAPWVDRVAIWKKTGELVILRKGMFQEVIFEANGKDIKYIQAELGPESDFIVLSNLEGES